MRWDIRVSKGARSGPRKEAIRACWSWVDSGSMGHGYNLGFSMPLTQENGGKEGKQRRDVGIISRKFPS